MAFDENPYALLKKAKQESALNVKNNANLALNGQETGINNNYASLMETLAKRKTDALTVKQGQLGEGENTYSTQRDQAVAGVNNSMSGARDWLASHNLSGSNENADQMGRMQTQLGNKLSGVNVSKNAYDTGVNNNFNALNTDITNSETTADRDKVKQIAEILTARTTADNNYNTEVQTQNGIIDAQKLQDFGAYNEKLRQEAIQAQQVAEQRAYEAQQRAQQQAFEANQQTLARQASASRSGGGSGSSATQAKANAKDELNQFTAELYNQTDAGNGDQYLTHNRETIVRKYGDATYQALRKTFEGYQGTANANIRKQDIYDKQSMLN